MNTTLLWPPICASITRVCSVSTNGASEATFHVNGPEAPS